jgi:hypothetical protein
MKREGENRDVVAWCDIQMNYHLCARSRHENGMWSSSPSVILAHLPSALFWTSYAASISMPWSPCSMPITSGTSGTMSCPHCSPIHWDLPLLALVPHSISTLIYSMASLCTKLKIPPIGIGIFKWNVATFTFSLPNHSHINIANATAWQLCLAAQLSSLLLKSDTGIVTSQQWVQSGDNAAIYTATLPWMGPANY